MDRRENELMAETVSSGRIFALLVALSVQIGCFRHQRPAAIVASNWNPRQAAAYLDQREAWWMQWPHAARDHGTFCVSCHTALPYALARPALDTRLGEADPPKEERALLANVKRRVTLWRDIEPYYTDQGAGRYKTAQSRGTEAVLNALVLANCDAQKGELSPESRAAFANMWELQETEGPEKGAWQWLQFDNEPFEGHDSTYYGAALAAVATGMAPNSYSTSPGIQAQVSLLREYLNHRFKDQSLINRVAALWASSELPGVLGSEQQESLETEIFTRQRTDGGWSLAPLSWSWSDWAAKSLAKLWLHSNTPVLTQQSDGYATGLITYVLERKHFSRDNPHLKRALDWLQNNQDPKKGFWSSLSLNNRVDPSTYRGRFMSDAATGYAVLALSGSQRN